MKPFLNNRLNRICLKVILWSVALLVLLYVLNHFIRPFVSGFIKPAIYSVSMILVYALLFLTILSLVIVVLNGIRKRIQS